MIEVSDLHFTYPGQPAPALRGLAFSVRPGEVFGFLGPSGSGKTTTQKILYKLLPGFEGEARVAGRRLAEWGRDFYRHIGVSFELPNHYLKLSARENLRFFAAFYDGIRPDLDRLLALVGLQDDADKPVADFSKGMKMRLNFIRALLHDPQVLFLDEPTSGLDPANARRIKDLILQMKTQNKTVFLTTHDMYVADQLCDRVALLDGGTIQALDAPSDLKLRYGRRQVRVTLEGDGRPRYFSLEGLGDNAAFLELLRSGKLHTIHSEEATLEDVFLAFTGRALE